MRLIDAVKLKEAAERLLADDELGLTEWDAVDDMINNAPTIDPFKDKSLEQLMDDAFTRGYYKGREVFNPVKHGRWIRWVQNKDEWPAAMCSECQDKVEADNEGKYPNYCPNCGARMDDGDDDDEID